MIESISTRLTCDLLCYQSVIFFPTGVTPAGKKMTLWQCGISRVVYRLGTNVSISRLLWKLGNTSICAESKHICTHMFHKSYLSHHWQFVDAQDTNEHTSACSCPYISLTLVDVQDTIEHICLCHGYCYYCLFSMKWMPGHEWVYWCSCMSCMSVYYYPWHCECPEHEWALLAYVVGILNSISLTHMYIYIYCNNIVIDIK